ncbi:MAG: rhomboid family intramembrane serine protease [Phycisphaerales bacterium]|nr:rhomboid family intramembrane serine protease [Phycisphaerales bacterium]
MLLPLGTDRPLRRRPRACETLLVVTVAAQVLVLLIGLQSPDSAAALVDAMSLAQTTAWTEPWTFLTYQFAHDSPFAGTGTGGGLWRLLHLAFNMLGLWVFGRPLEDRLGHVGLLGVYLGGGIVAGLAQVLDSPGSVIGASGSVCALVGAFAMLLPRVHIRVLVIFILIGIWTIPSLWVVGFWVVLDLVGFAGGGKATTAYAAHLGGYVGGVGAGLLLLLCTRPKGDDVDALWLFRQWRRRQHARAVLTTPTPPPPTPVPHDADRAPQDDVIEEHAWLRDVEAAMHSGRSRGGMQRWMRECDRFPDACLSAPVQLDLANHLQAGGHHAEAADAYRRMLDNHGDHPESPMVRLMLGVLLIRHLHRPDDARPLLLQARDQLHDDAQRALAIELLETTS